MTHPRVPCARCGRPQATGGRRQPPLCCVDCREVDPAVCDLLTGRSGPIHRPSTDRPQAPQQDRLALCRNGLRLEP